MHFRLLFIRALFLILCPVLLTLLITTQFGEASFSMITIGIIVGFAIGSFIVALEYISEKLNIGVFNLFLVGLFCGFLMGQAFLFPINAVISTFENSISPATFSLITMAIFLISSYLGVILTFRASDQLRFIIPFVQLEHTGKRKKDIIVDSSALLDTRIIDLATTGLLDNHLIVPQFVLKELHFMNEHGDEHAKTRARRCFEVLRKLESIENLNICYIDSDFPDLKEIPAKLAHLARVLNATIITADTAKSHHTNSEGIRTVNIHALSNAFKAIPQAGETLTIKIQRKGKEAGQGVGYLEDGTMVVVNGGEEFIFETIKAQILSVKSTSSGRMIFCNASENETFDRLEEAFEVASKRES